MGVSDDRGILISGSLRFWVLRIPLLAPYWDPIFSHKKNPFLDQNRGSAQSEMIRLSRFLTRNRKP